MPTTLNHQPKPPIRPPLGLPPAAAAQWIAVIETAGRCCQCTGECGRPHRRTDGRCPVEHAGYANNNRPLHVAPADALPAPYADPADLDLRAWCDACFTGAARLARRTAEAHQAETAAANTPALFDL